VSRYQIGKTNLDFTEARDSEWQWHQLGRVQVCTSLQTDNHANTPPLSFLQAGCPSCHPTNNSVKALKAKLLNGKLEKSRSAYSRQSVLTGRTVCCIAVIEHQPVVSWTAVEPPHTSAYDNWRTGMFSLRDWTKRTH